MDFADALHLAGSLHADKFASFDKKLRNKAIALKTGVMMVDP
jgi:predicted nucleic acid-binding protein